MMQITQEEAYAQACRSLGEAVVTQTFLAQEIARLTAENEALRAQVPDSGVSP